MGLSPQAFILELLKSQGYLNLHHVSWGGERCVTYPLERPNDN